MAAVYQYTVKRTVLTHRKAVQTTSLKQVYRVLQMIEEQLKLVSIIARKPPFVNLENSTEKHEFPL